MALTQWGESLGTHIRTRLGDGQPVEKVMKLCYVHACHTYTQCILDGDLADKKKGVLIVKRRHPCQLFRSRLIVQYKV